MLYLQISVTIYKDYNLFKIQRENWIDLKILILKIWTDTG